MKFKGFLGEIREMRGYRIEFFFYNFVNYIFVSRILHFEIFCKFITLSENILSINI